LNIFLLRHGACEEPREDLPDSERRLTDEGRRAVEESLPGMRALIGQVDFIVSSPLSRARETSDIVAQYFKCLEFVDYEPKLAEAGGEKRVAVVLNKLIGKENVLIVGHMPYLSDLVTFFAREKHETPVDIKKSGMAKLHFKNFLDPGEGSLLWTMTAEELKNAG